VPTADAADTDGEAADALVARWVAALSARFGDNLAAVLLYGSYLRGKRDTPLDFYALLHDYERLPGTTAARRANRLLPPNVYFLRLGDGSGESAAKVATITIAAFLRAVEHDFHPYFRARFCQPHRLLAVCDPAVAACLDGLAERAAVRLLADALPLLPATVDAAEAWRGTFRLTYRTELRAEDPGRADVLHAHYAAHLDALFARAAPRLALVPLGAGRWRNPATPGQLVRARRAWWARRAWGRVLSVARLAKAALTFDDPLGYVLWKVARHSGVQVEASARARRHPLLFGWGVLWRLYRAGGFR